MKLEILIENEKPLIVLSDNINRDKTIDVYSVSDGHATATRAYLRTLRKPETLQEYRAAWLELAAYCAHAAMASK